ncbi:DUF732 domain-containing protein [Streptomyces glomeratus]|uniref:DUF732 domain-containing protein n=1 Tax=Streptomyces glomeratus TaxID=284452 RepID=A0ABP6L0C8_9ACTN|nr:hypothetical protein [Streptomyces glomeratus]MCF1509083.1 hypothetical protein [Streptomyces glomeratus]
MNGKKKALLIAGGVLVVAAIANAGNGDDTDTPTKAKPAVKVSTSPKAKPSEAPAPIKFDEPNAAEEKQLLSKLHAINPGITVNEERAVRRSVNTCQEMQAGNSMKSIVTNTSARFTGGDATVDERQAAEVVKAVKDTFCG